jgi:heterodisulfide reductase subunit A
MSEPVQEVLVYGFGLGGLRSAVAAAKLGYKAHLLLRGHTVDAIPNQVLAHLPFDMCFACAWFPLRGLIGMGKVSVAYNARLESIEGEAGEFRVTFTTQPPPANEWLCTGCYRCVDACSVSADEASGDGHKAIRLEPVVAWDPAVVIDRELCTHCGDCVDACPTQCLQLDRPPERRELRVGAIVLAPEYEATPDDELEQFGVGRIANVVRDGDVAREQLTTGPHWRAYRRRSDGRAPASVAIIVTPQFSAADRDHDFLWGCSYAAYRARCGRELLGPDTRVAIFVRSFEAAGAGRERMYRAALAAGAQVRRCDEITVAPAPGDRVRIGTSGSQVGEGIEEFDLAIVVTGQRPPAETAAAVAADVAGIEWDEHGFARTTDFSPVRTARPGIFAVGEYSGPKGDVEAIWDAYSVGADLVALFGKPKAPPAPVPPRDVSREPPRIAVVFCRCGGAFDDAVDIPTLERQAGQLPHVVHASTVDVACVPQGLGAVAEQIKQCGANRVVFAACGIVVKGGRFAKAMDQAGLSASLMQHVRLMEDAAWAVGSREAATEKAFQQIAAHCALARGSQAYGTDKAPVMQRGLVIGGGLAGMVAARALASAGVPVDLVERQAELGGRLRAVRQRLDGLDTQALIEQVRADIEAMQLVEVYTGASVTHVHGAAGDFAATIQAGDGPLTRRYGSIILATGAAEHAPREKWAYAHDERVLTQTELGERLSEGNAPTGHVVMVQCVGSRDEEHAYCSRVCCGQAAANALALREAHPESNVTIVYRDLNLYGRKRALLDRLGRAAVELLRVSDDIVAHAVNVEPRPDGVHVTVAGADGRSHELRADCLVLSTGIEPDRDLNDSLSRMTGLGLTADGFFDSDAQAFPFEEMTKKNKPLETQFNAVFAVGLAHSPRGVRETIHTALDAAGKALHTLTKAALAAPAMWENAETVEAFCAGCGLCVDACPYYARVLARDSGLAVVLPHLCEGCGTCAAVCPSGAARVRNTRPRQVLAAIDELLLA